MVYLASTSGASPERWEKERIVMNKLITLGSRDILGKTVTAFGTVENPIFSATDVAEWIEHSNVSAMLQGIDDDEKVLLEVPTIDSNDCLESTKQGNLRTKRWFLTEDGLYEVLFLSRKPVAKEFKKCVKKLLHDLRTGKASVTSSAIPPFPSSDSHHLFYVGDKPLAVPQGVPFSLSVSKTGVLTVRVKESKPPVLKEPATKEPLPKTRPKTPPKPKGVTLTGKYLKAANKIVAYLYKEPGRELIVNAIFQDKNIVSWELAKWEFDQILKLLDENGTIRLSTYGGTTTISKPR